MENKNYLYCSKNVVNQVAYGDNHCGGPKGNGIEETCLKNCSNACTNEKELVEQIGLYIIRKAGI